MKKIPQINEDVFLLVQNVAGQVRQLKPLTVTNARNGFLSPARTAERRLRKAKLKNMKLMMFKAVSIIARSAGNMTEEKENDSRNVPPVDEDGCIGNLDLTDLTGEV